MARRRFAAVFVLFSLVIPAHFSFADPLWFETPEYWASTGLASIKASDAYSLGFTGKGVTVAVVDAFFASQGGEFAGKYPYGILGDNDEPDKHGVHVSGIIAAAKNSYGMHGVAFDASLMPINLDYGLAEKYKLPSNAWRATLAYPQVKIINNSWGENFHLDSDYSNYYGNFFATSANEFWEKLAETYRYEDLIDAAKEAGMAGKLLLVAAGNEGHSAPSATAGLPTMVERGGGDNSAFVRNWISVSSFDPRFAPDDPRFISHFSNLGEGASEYTLLAPGSDIYSTIGPNSYGYENGTSMATPYASGVAALVQQAFPYMDGKQMADVLLSTATAMDTAGSRPDFFILQQRDFVVTEETDGSDTDYSASTDDLEAQSIIVYTYSGSGYSGILTDEQRAFYLERLDCTDAELDDALQNSVATYNLADYTALFGQGIINALMAVQGPGYFNADRLDPTEDLSSGEFGGDYAMYGVNTQGFDSTWSNDIGQRQGTEANALQGLDVGLRKQGDGMLYLTGANDYRGPTVVEGGGLSLGKEGYSGASVYESVYVRAGGLFTGDGTVGFDAGTSLPVPADLVSEGVLMPGLESDPGSTLTVTGDVTGTGTLRLVLGQNGLGNSLEAQNIIMGGGLEVTGGNGAPIRPYTNYNNLLNAAGSLDVTGLADRVTVSPFLSFSTVQTGQSLSLVSSTNALNSLPGVPGRTNDVAGALEHMFHNLDGNPLQRELDFLYNQSRENFLDTAAALRGDIQAATLVNRPLQGRLMPLVRRDVLKPGAARGTEDIPEQFTLQSGKKGPDVWIRPMAGYSSVDKKSSIGQDSTHSSMQGLAVGLEHSLDNLYGGALLAVGHSDVEQGNADACIWDMRAGLYGGWTGGGFNVSALVNAGWQTYKVSRHIPVPGDSTYLKSSFNGYSAGLGLEAAYNVLHGMSDTVALSPFVAFDLEYIRQESRDESGNAVFALKVRDKDFCRTSVNPGLSVEAAPNDWLVLSASGGYRRLLSGHEPEISAAFRADSSYRFDAVAPDEGKDFVTYSLGAEASPARDVTLTAKLFGENSDRSQSYGGYLNMRFEW